MFVCFFVTRTLHSKLTSPSVFVHKTCLRVSTSGVSCVIFAFCYRTEYVSSTGLETETTLHLPVSNKQSVLLFIFASDDETRAVAIDLRETVNFVDRLCDCA